MNSINERCVACETWKIACPVHKKVWQDHAKKCADEERFISDCKKRDAGERAVDAAFERFVP